MPIDVIIPNATPWIIKNADFAPGETYATSPGLNVMNMAVAEMARRGYVAGAQIKQAAADVEADKEQLAALQAIRQNDYDSVDTRAKALALLSVLSGVIPSGFIGMTSAIGTSQRAAYEPVASGVELRVVYPPEPEPANGAGIVSVQPGATYVPVTYRGADGAIFYYQDVYERLPNGNTLVRSQQKQFLESGSLAPIGPFNSDVTNLLSQTIKPSRVDAEIDKTVQISQGKQTYLQSLSTDYANFLNTTNNLLQDYLKMLSSVIAKLG